jgi:hypothetical protein
VGLPGHQRRKFVLVAGKGFSDHGRGVICRLGNEPADRVLDRNRLVRREAELGRRLLGCMLGHPQLRVEPHLADDRMERSFYQRGIGYDVPVREVVTWTEGKDVVETVTETTEHIPGDVGAQRSWLTNRRPKQWRDKDVGEVPPERSSAEIKEIILQKFMAWGVKLVPADPPLIEGEAAKVTNGVARIGVKTRGPNG